MTEVPHDLLREANREHWTRTMVHPSDASIVRVPIVADGKVVGFYTPRRASCGAMRIGPLYVRPEYRRRGLALSVYESIRVPMIACIEDDNDGSTRLHERAGFTRWKRYSNGWWWRRDAR